MGKFLLRLALAVVLVTGVSCAKIVTVPVQTAVNLTLKPAKIITDAAVDLVEKPVRTAISVVKPQSLVKNGLP